MRNAIIFDYDGVIVDSFSNIYEAYQEIFAAIKMPLMHFDEFHEWYDPEWHNNFRRMGILGTEQEAKGVEIFKDVTQNRDAPLFEGMDKVITELTKRYNIALVSSNYEEEVEKRLKKHNLYACFDIVIPALKNTIKPDPTQFFMAMDHMKVSPAEISSIGDTVMDISTGRNAGVSEVVTVTYGYESKEKQEAKCEKLGIKPDKMLHSPAEILQFYS